MFIIIQILLSIKQLLLISFLLKQNVPILPDSIKLLNCGLEIFEESSLILIWVMCLLLLVITLYCIAVD